MTGKKIKNVFVDGPVTADFIASSIAKHNCKKDIGAHSIFLGQVRSDLIDDKEVKAIDYTTYREMADEVFHRIREEAFAKYPLTCLHIYHSLGRVNAGEISLFVFTSSVRRGDAIKACSEIVEQVKMHAPVWGKEIFEDESHQWKENR